MDWMVRILGLGDTFMTQQGKAAGASSWYVSLDWAGRRFLTDAGVGVRVGADGRDGRERARIASSRSERAASRGRRGDR